MVLLSRGKTIYACDKCRKIKDPVLFVEAGYGSRWDRCLKEPLTFCSDKCFMEFFTKEGKHE